MNRRCICAIFAGLCVPFAFAPVGWWPLAIIATSVLLTLLRGTSGRQSGLLGWCYGLGMFGHGIWWIQVSVHQFGLPYYAFSVGVTILLVAILALYTAIFAWSLAKFRARGAPLLMAAPALWVLSEYLRGWLFSGFPWLSLGYSQIDAPTAGVAPLMGVFACSGIVVLQGAILAEFLRATAPKRLWLTGAFAAILLLGAQLATLEFSKLESPTLSVALIQGAVPQELKWRSEIRSASIALYEQLSAEHWDADVLIWPETAIPAFPHQIEQTMAALDRQARDTSTDLLIGMPTGEPWNGEYYNSLVDFGATPGRYSKRHLVPYGEYFPLKGVLAGIATLLQIPMSDFSAGGHDQVSLDVAGHLAGISICYEDVFGGEVIASLPNAAFLINVSNDAWFGDSIAPHQHLEIARMRALETARYLLRSTNSGITAIIDHRGDIRAVAPQFVETSLRGTFQARSGATPYVRFGDLPILVLMGLAAALSYALGWCASRSN
jgi:apolipoprotein N-acyltransferase